MTKKRIAIYTGTFDPVTNGHIDIIRRALKIFDKLIVSVALNPRKNPLFTIEQRVDFIQEGFKGLKHVEILPFDNLLTDFAQANNASVIIKGLRAVSDFEYELQMGLMNRNLDESIETINLSKIFKARRMISMCPLVTGSNVPVYIAMRFFVIKYCDYY
jgi:pantetheine-phosphate adenylyltransferase